MLAVVSLQLKVCVSRSSRPPKGQTICLLTDETHLTVFFVFFSL